jgi:hypothetical protein
MKALVLSHAHPAFSIGGAQVASYNLFQAMKRQPGWDAHYIAGVGPPVARHAATPLMSLGQAPDETLFWTNDYDWFHLGLNDTGALIQHFERFLADLRPDIVNFHHVMGFGIQAIRATRRALGDVPIVYTLHEFLPICAHHGQMIKAKNGALCMKASASDCGMCFPQIGAAKVVSRMWWKLPSSGLRACDIGSSQAARSRDIGTRGWDRVSQPSTFRIWI